MYQIQDCEATFGKKMYMSNNSSMKNIETLQMNKTDEYTDGVSENSDENIITSTRFGLKGQTV